MRLSRLLAFLLLALTTCDSGTTQVRLLLDYDETWPLSTFSLTARDRTTRLHALTPDGTKTREFIVSLPDEWIGAAITYTVRGYVGIAPEEELYASGHVTLTALRNEVSQASVTLSRTLCAAWCSPGAKSCRNGGVSVCELSETGCPRWSTPALCVAGQGCSLGECSATCTDECASGETRCSGPLGVEVCGQSDDDSCLDWQPSVLCSGGQVCSNGHCGESCDSECMTRSSRCRDSGISSCGDVNGDGCLEWGPSVSCAASESCQMNGSEPSCVPRAGCTDECSNGSCSGNTLTSCGNYDLDPCREPSPGLSCVLAERCQVGTCDSSANSGAGACVAAARVCNTPSEASCLTASTRRVFDANGTCNADTGQCVYPYRDFSCRTCTSDWVECGDLCADGCPSLPMVGDKDRACYLPGSGSCSSGVCSYQYNAGSCDDGESCTVNDTCSNGSCSGTPMTCPSRDPSCEDGVARTYNPDGRCMSGACQYSIRSEQSCTNGCFGNACASSLSTGAIAVTAGQHHTCAIRQDRRVVCWGNNIAGQLGNGEPSTAESTPVVVQGLTDVTALALGNYHSCALRMDRTVHCWGQNLQGQLGVGDLSARLTPTAADVTNVRAISAGLNFTCALLNDGTVQCWGDNEHGAVGDGSFIDADFPRAVRGLSDVSAIASGTFHSCAVLNNQSVRCWGMGWDGQLGSGVTNSAVTVAVPGLTQATRVAVGSTFSCALRSDLTVHCWGRGDNGELGREASPEPLPPGPVTNLTNVIELAARGGHSCALLADRTLRCWGTGGDGQLGNGRTDNAFAASAVLNVNNAAAITVGAWHSCTVITGNIVQCWGKGDVGQLGNARSGDSYRETLPVAVAGIP